jgi:peptidoglycan hydrolase-like protein with peptidoglycan-binding domain
MNIQTTLIGLAIAMFSVGAYAAQEEQGSMSGGQQQSQMQQQAPDMSHNTSVVSQVQQKLKDQGYEVASTDGTWGPETQQAISKFQQDKGLSASGEINTETLSALGFSSSDIAAFEQQTREQEGSQPAQQQEQQGGGSESGGSSD